MIKTVVFHNGSEKEGRKKFKFLYDLSESSLSTYIVLTKGLARTNNGTVRRNSLRGIEHAIRSLANFPVTFVDPF